MVIRILTVLKSVLLAFRPPALPRIINNLDLLLAHHPQLRHVLMEAVHPPIATAAFCVRLARIKTELV